MQYVRRILSTLKEETERRPDDLPGGNTRPADLAEGLTRRELEILTLLTLHLSNKEIGARLFIGTETVKHHMKNIYGKLGVHSRRDAVTKAKLLGVLGDDAASGPAPD